MQVSREMCQGVQSRKKMSSPIFKASSNIILSMKFLPMSLFFSVFPGHSYLHCIPCHHPICVCDLGTVSRTGLQASWGVRSFAHDANLVLGGCSRSTLETIGIHKIVATLKYSDTSITKSNKKILVIIPTRFTFFFFFWREGVMLSERNLSNSSVEVNGMCILKIDNSVNSSFRTVGILSTWNQTIGMKFLSKLTFSSIC